MTDFDSWGQSRKKKQSYSQINLVVQSLDNQIYLAIGLFIRLLIREEVCTVSVLFVIPLSY